MTKQFKDDDMEKLYQLMAKAFKQMSDSLRTELRSEIKEGNDSLRDELRGEIKAGNDSLRTELHAEIEELRRDTNDGFTKYHEFMVKEFDKVNDRFDQVDRHLGSVDQNLDFLVGEYKVLIDEQAAIATAHVRIDETLENHEERMVKLETRQQAA